ncbi:MAG: cell division protein ZapE [Proteobacteria bacterium]|nr:cell division protein ZapE [Pseudomonadota bacterium]
MQTALRDLYRQRLEAGKITADPGQKAAVQALQELQRHLPKLMRPRLPFFPASEDKRGLYLYGPVGRGKTMLMDLFFEGAEGVKKRRVHFHAFMAEVHRRLHALRGEDNGNALDSAADEIVKEAELLCFDEFQVYNIADAMILGRLFRTLFREGAVVVATSNTAPDDLYKDGLQRALFLPFIDILKKRMKVLPIGGGEDHRLARLKGLPVYMHPHDAKAHAMLADIFLRLTDTGTPASEELTIDGRKLVVPRAAKEVAWFTFDDLCRKPLAPSDYLVLCGRYHTFLIENVPMLPDADRGRDATLRFIHLIDILYEKHANVVISAEVKLEKLMEPGHSLYPRFERTQSRLFEMQSEEYMRRPHPLLKAVP